MSEAKPTRDGLEQEMSEELYERLEEQEPSEEEKDRLHQQHQGHLVRDSTSQLKLDEDVDLEGVEVHAEATIPDTFCFSCGEWIGFSGVDLLGKPRSRSEAYYMGGTPLEVQELRKRVRTENRSIGQQAQADIGHIETAEDALDFIIGELEQMKDDLGGSE